VDESLLDEAQLLREVEAEEQEQEMKLKNQQNKATGSFFSRMFNRNIPPPTVSLSGSAGGQQWRGRPGPSPSSMRRTGRYARNDEGESGEEFVEEEEEEEDSAPAPRVGAKWQQARSKVRNAAAFRGSVADQRRPIHAANARRDSREDDEQYEQRGGGGKGKMAKSVFKVMQSTAFTSAGKVKPKPPPPVDDYSDGDDLPPPADFDDDEDNDGWDAPPPLDASDQLPLPPRQDRRAVGIENTGKRGKGGSYDMPPPPDDDDLPPPPDSEEDDAPPPIVVKNSRNSKRL
jgi:hypothetical protein